MSIRLSASAGGDRDVAHRDLQLVGLPRRSRGLGFGRLGEKFVDLGLERRVRLRARQSRDGLDLRAPGLRVRQEEDRRAVHPRLCRVGNLPSNVVRVLLRGHACFEPRGVQPHGLGVRFPGLELLLVGEQPIVHLPVLSLLAGASSRLRGLEGVFVDRFQRVVPPDVLQFPGGDVFLVDLRGRLTDVPGTEGSLVVGEFDQRQLRISIALEGAA